MAFATFPTILAPPAPKNPEQPRWRCGCRTYVYVVPRSHLQLATLQVEGCKMALDAIPELPQGPPQANPVIGGLTGGAKLGRECKVGRRL